MAVVLRPPKRCEDAQVTVLDVAGGHDVVRKGGPNLARADFLVIDKTDRDLRLKVDVEQMVTDATAARDRY